jgi:paraquat-inducible protein A
METHSESSILTRPAKVVICNFCSFQIPVDSFLPGTLICECCGEMEKRLKPKSAELTLAYSLTALILYLPANIFPFMTIELYGNRNSSTIWSGIVSLFDSGSWAIGLVVFIASMIIPCLKLITLFYLALFAKQSAHPRLLTRLYRLIEAIGRWSMLDIFLLAVLVAIMKLGPWTSVKPELGSLLFVFVVVFTMLASSSFDPRLLWEVKNDKPE